MTLHPDRSDADRLELATALRTLRRAAGLSGDALGRRVFMSQAKISKIENGRVIPSITDVELIAHALGAEPEQARELIGLARVANSEYRSDRSMSRHGQLARQLGHLALERQCRLHRTFLPTMLVAKTQTPAYLRRAVGNLPDQASPEVIDEIMAGKALRSQLLDDLDHEFVFLHTEAALRWRLIDATGMAEQMEHLATVGERPNVSVEVIPFDAVVPAGPLHMFMLYDDRLASIEVKTGLLMLRDPVDVSFYVDTFEYYRRHALRDTAARDFILSVAEDFRGDTRD